MEAPNWFMENISAPTTEHQVLVNGARIAYRAWNIHASLPGLLFVHGYGAHSHWWDFIAPAFANDYRVAAMDMSGAGDSDHRQHYSARTFALEIIKVAQALGEGTIVVGHSFGGTMTRIAGFEQGNVLGGVVLVDSSITPHRGTREAPPAPKSQTRYYPSLAQGMRRFRLRPPQPCANDYMLAHIARHSLRASESGYSFKLDQALFAKMVTDQQPPLPDATTMLAAITCPVGIIYGELSRFYPAETRLLLESLLPANCIKGVPKAHHHVFLDQPLAFIRDLQDLLKHMRQR